MDSVATVLLVQPDHAELNMYRRFLRGQGFSVLAVTTAEEALAIAHGADAIICELRLGSRTTGIQLIEQIRRSKRTKARPIIVLTACDLTCVHDLALITGCNRVLVKPCQRDVLLRTIREVLQESAA